MSGTGVSPGPRYVHALALGVDPSWRRLPAAERAGSAVAFFQACAGGLPRTVCYSCVGLEPRTDLLLWSLGPSLAALEERAAAALRSGLGAWTVVRQSLVGVLAPSPYASTRPSEPPLFNGRRARFLIVYPFTKHTEWYRLSQQARQGIMNEHIRIGRRYPQVRQLLANAFGLGDQDYVVAYETDDPAAFSSLVRDLRAAEGRRATLRDTPLLRAVQRPPDEAARLLGA